MKPKLLKIFSTRRTISVLSSSNMFRFIVGLMVFDALWIALTGLYPMAFDEDFHFGIIKIYAHHISPFWNSQPEAANSFGAVYRDPSYLYHYLMSFPYRFISIFTHDQTIQVIFLRLINIGSFVWGILIFNRVLSLTKASKALINSTLLIFILIPVIPLLAAHINYDNLIFPLTGLTFLLTLKVTERLRKSKSLKLEEIFGLAIVLLLSSIVKYAFLPILLVILVYLIINIHRTFPSWITFVGSLKSSWLTASIVVRTLLTFAVIFSVGLFSQRYVLNTYLYHTPVPECSKVLNVKACSEYGPWVRDHNFKQDKPTGTPNFIIFSGNWFYGMWYRLFFSLSGASNHYETRGTLFFPSVISIGLSVSGIFITLKYYRRIIGKYNRHALQLFAYVSAAYVFVLFFDQFRAFSSTGQPVAINGRYLLPVLLPIMLIVGLAFGQLLKSNIRLKVIFVSITILCMLWGGGAITYIIRSNDDASWWWPNTYVIRVNRNVKSVLHSVIPGFYDRGEFFR